jgi:protein O-GlcNAc transferase
MIKTMNINPSEKISSHIDSAPIERLQTLFNARQFEEGLALCQQIQAQKDGALWYWEGNFQFALGNHSEAKHCFEKAFKLNPDEPLYEWRSKTTCPTAWQSTAEISHYRLALYHYLSTLDLLPFELTWDTLTTLMIEPSFYLMYHGENDKPIKSEFGRLFEKALHKAFPDEMIPAQVSLSKPESPIHLGFLVTEKHEGVFCKLNAGFINHLNPDQFAIRIFCDTQESASAIATHIEPFEVEYIILPLSLQSKIHRIQKEHLDILFHFEIGSDATNYFLPYFPLAQHQITSMGLPVTSGIPAVKHFLSGIHLEAMPTDRHYTETCHLMPTMPVYFYRPKLTEPLKPKALLDLPENNTIYLCPQTLNKIHPTFIPILAEILLKDENGIIGMISGHDALEKQIQQQLQLALNQLSQDADQIHSAQSRLIFLPRVNSETFLHRLAQADVMLDPSHVNGGITSFEGFAFGNPIVTWPGQTFRNRMTAACYLQMGITEGIVDSQADYVQKALDWGKSPEKRARVRQQILENNHLLFENPTTINSIESLFKEIVALKPDNISLFS